MMDEPQQFALAALRDIIREIEDGKVHVLVEGDTPALLTGYARDENGWLRPVYTSPQAKLIFTITKIFETP